MIHDLTDLEPLVHQYDHEKVLIGPLLNLCTNSSFRVFNIACNSSKIHETIGLGFFELEIDAQRRRADIVAALEGCFGEVEMFDSQVEMARTAHTLWANDETARFLATVSSEPKPCPTGEIIALPNVTDPRPTHAPQSADDQLQPTLACDLAQTAEPLYLHNLSDADTFANPGTLAEPGSNLEIVRNLPAAVADSSVWKKYQLLALSAAYLAMCFVVGFLIGTMVFTSL